MLQSMKDYVDYLEKNHAEQTAFRWIEDETNTIAEKSFIDFAADIRKFIGYLYSSCRETDGKHFALLAANCYHYAVAVYAILCVNAVALPLNYRERDEVLSAQIKDADVDYIISDDSIGEMKSGLIAGCALPKLSITAYPSAQPSEIHDSNDVNRLALLMFTSGTSGKNKCVQHSLKTYFDATEIACDLYDDVQQTYGFKLDRYFFVLPMFHIFGISNLIRSPYIGMTLNLCLDFRNIDRDLLRLDSNFTAAVPVFVENWTKALMRGRKEVLCGIKGILCGGAALDPSTVRILKDNGLKMIQGYGMTETFTTGAYNLMENPENMAQSANRKKRQKSSLKTMSCVSAPVRL